MGWQLFPLGIGWRDFKSTADTGDFVCANPRCKSVGQPAAYAHQAGRNWFTLFFVPLIPLNRTGEWIKCKKCKSLFPVDILRGSSSVVVVESVPPTAPQQTMSRPSDVPAARAVVSHASAGEVCRSLRFSDGTVVNVIGNLVIGREPHLVDGFPNARLHTVSDQTVSKTHLVVGYFGDAVWILDHNSSNGVFVGPSVQHANRIPAGCQVVVANGSVVSVGDSTAFTLEELR